MADEILAPNQNTTPEELIAQQQQTNFQSQNGPSPVPLLPPQPQNLQEAIDPSMAAQQVLNQQAQAQSANTTTTAPEVRDVQNYQSMLGQDPSDPLGAPSVDQLRAGSKPLPAAATPTNPNISSSDYLDKLNKINNDIVQTYQTQQNVAQKAGDIGNQIEQKKADFYGQQAGAAQAAQSQVQDAYEQSSKRVEQQMQDRQKAVDSYKEMLTPEKINDAFRPRGLFEGRGVASGILGAIAIGLGGAGAAAQGGGATNQALAMMMKQLDKENEGRVNAFKTGLAGQQNLADEATKTAGMARQQGQDASQNALQNKALQLETIQAKVEQMAAPYKGQMAGLNAQGLIAGLQKEKDAVKMQFQQQQMQREMMQSLRGLSFDDYNKLSPAVKTMLPPEYNKQMDEVRERQVPGYGAATNKEVAGEFNKARPILENGMNATQRLMDFTNHYNMYSPAQRATADTQVKALMGPMREAMGMKTLTDGDQKLLTEMIGNPNSILKLDSQKRARLDAIKQIFSQDLSSRAKAAGLTPQTGTDVDAAMAQKYGITAPNFKK